MSYDYKEKKIVAVLASNIEIGIAMNVLGHLSVAIGYNINNNMMGQNPISDKSGVKHLGISKYPFITTKVKQSKIRNVIEKARKKSDIIIADYPKDMLETSLDDELTSQLASKEEIDIEYLGVILCGDAKQINEMTGKFQLYN